MMRAAFGFGFGGGVWGVGVGVGVLGRVRVDFERCFPVGLGLSRHGPGGGDRWGVSQHGRSMVEPAQRSSVGGTRQGPCVPRGTRRAVTRRPRLQGGQGIGFLKVTTPDPVYVRPISRAFDGP